MEKSIIIKERVKIMKKSKRISALIAAVLMTVTVFTSAVPAFAAGKSDTKTISCGGQGAICSLSSKDKNNAQALTTSVKNFDYIYAYVIGCEVDSRGEVVRYVGTPSEKTNATSAGNFAVIKTLSSSNRFENLSSAHIVKKGSAEKGATGELHWY